MEVPEGAANELQHRAYAATLMARIGTGDEHALTELMHLYTPYLTRIAFALLGTHDLKLEVVQDVFVALWERRNALDDVSNIPGYLARAVRNRALNIIRSEKRYQRALDHLTLEGLDSATTILDAPANGAHNEELAQKLLAVIHTLPESPRRVLLLHWYAHMPYDEIATLLGVQQKTVRQLMYRALRALAGRYPGS